jgi:hypothetical protein
LVANEQWWLVEKKPAKVSDATTIKESGYYFDKSVSLAANRLVPGGGDLIRIQMSPTSVFKADPGLTGAGWGFDPLQMITIIAHNVPLK